MAAPFLANGQTNGTLTQVPSPSAKKHWPVGFSQNSCRPHFNPTKPPHLAPTLALAPFDRPITRANASAAQSPKNFRISSSPSCFALRVLSVRSRAQLRRVGRKVRITFPRLLRE